MKIGNASSPQPLSPKRFQVTGNGVYQKLAGCQPSINFTMTQPVSGITASTIHVDSVAFQHSSTNSLRTMAIEADVEIY